MVATVTRSGKPRWSQRQHTDYAHIGPGALAGEYLRQCYWHPILRSDRITPGHAKPVRLLGEDFTLFRGESGTPHVIASRCAHRGMQLSPGWVEGDCIRCFYHGWKYDQNGQCVEQPAEPRPFAQKVKIAGYPTREYLGLVWAYLGSVEPVEFPRYPDFEDFEGILDVHSGLRKCNYFNNVENGLDNAHIGFVHRGLPGAVDGFGNPTFTDVEETEWGIQYLSKWKDGAVLLSHYGMPYMKHTKALPRYPDLMPYSEFITFKVPIDDENHVQYLVYKYPIPHDKQMVYWERRRSHLKQWSKPHHEVAEQMLEGELDWDEVDPTKTELLRVQDDVSQVGQGRIADRVNERLGKSDLGVILLRKIWKRELRAFAEGGPTKQWAYDPETLHTDSVPSNVSG